MKLLFVENLAPALVETLADIFQGSLHVRQVGLKSSSDGNVWDYAAEMGYTIVTKDGRFPSAQLRLRSATEGDLDRARQLLDKTNRRASSHAE